jgi:hypothetical protein
MKKFNGTLLLAFLACFAFITAPAFADEDEVEKQSTKLKYKAQAKWNILLPQETFTKVGGTIALGNGFVVEMDGPALHVDANGDGKPDTKAKGTGGLINLKGKDAAGDAFTYTIRLRNEGQGWQWSASGVFMGKVAGEKIVLIDQNNNGKYNEYGVDAMIIGKGDVACYLSKVVSVKGTLYEMEVSENGREVAYKPFEGKAGVLNLAKDYKAKAKLLAAIVRSENGDYSYNMAGLKKGLLIPEGLYSIVAGKIAKGSETALIKQGESKPIRVSADEPSNFAWGGPIRAEFTYDRSGTDVTFSPQSLWYYGQAGEEYHQWIPDGKPPRFVIKDAKGREIKTASFGGC